uniref:VWFA domain-containing protein n=1 Tax=Panagrolaimus superbus TaxID=310955 RepID=A0A914XSN2_9BILA
MLPKLQHFLEAFTFGQNGKHTIRIGVITYATNVVIQYQLTDTTDFNSFVDFLFNLAFAINFNDSGGNVQNALQEAYYLWVSQKSFRRSLIILIAAAYDKVGFQGADKTAHVIKNNGIHVIVINFATSDGVLTFALENIASSGYYYISSQDQLYLRLPYALAQNCLFGFNSDILPTFANRVCQPGVLAAVTSQSKLDFITDNIVPYAFSTNQKKKFTIGLHKSASDNFEGEWKWWGYNKTEYPLENFPSMVDIPDPKDNYGYMWNHYGFNWSLQTGNNIPLPYICQLRACDAEYICDQKQTKQKFKLI